MWEHTVREEEAAAPPKEAPSAAERYLPLEPQEDPTSGLVILKDGSTATISVIPFDGRHHVNHLWERLAGEPGAARLLAAVAPGAGDAALEPAADGPAPAHDGAPAGPDRGDDPGRSFVLAIRRGVEDARYVAVGAYVATDDPSVAEVAMAVDAEHEGQGLGSLLLERLARVAVRQGILTFSALTGADNHRMLRVFRGSGFDLEETKDGSGVRVTFSVTPGPSSIARQERHDRLATVASLNPFFRPRGVAVIGASRNPASIGGRLLSSLLDARFEGPVYPVNPRAESVGSIHAYPSILDVPGPVDLAIIAVPRGAVLDTVDECAKKGVRALVVITAGFAETDDEGRALQDELLAKVRGYGMRMIGPNCLGILNTDPRVSLNASFAPIFPPPGPIAMSSQSGALGLAILEYVRDLGLGMSSFASVGNKADVSGNDLLQYWEGDDETELILLYLESFGNPRRFARLARRIGRSKPILAVKGGRTSAGRRAAGSHTAALAASDAAVEALFHQTGVIRADTLEDMFDIAGLLANQPLPRGRRVAVLTNAGGPGILAADALEAAGLTLPSLGEKTRERLASFLPAAASLENPVDMIASADEVVYRKGVPALLEADEVDAVLVIYIPVGLGGYDDVAAAIRDGVAEARRAGAEDKPVLACFMGARGVRSPLTTDEEIIPSYRFPESAAKALAMVTDYADWRRRPQGKLIDLPGIDTMRARRVCETARERGATWLSADEVREVLEAVGMPVLPGGVARSAAEAVELADKVGYPVAVKLVSETIVHKTDIGGVHLNVADAAGVERAYRAIEEAVAETGRSSAMDGVLVQPMVKGSAELVMGVADDPGFGPLIAFGLGGIHVEILKDVVFRITPLTDLDARNMIKSIRGYQLLEGYRGHPPADQEALADTLLRLSRLVEEVPEIAELDLNPVMALEPGRGCRIVDARIALHARQEDS